MQSFVNLFILLLVPFCVYSEGLPLSVTDGGNRSLVNNCVRVITGDYTESVCDLLIPGPENLSFERFYSSSNRAGNSLGDNWRHNHDTYLSSGVDYDTFGTSVSYTNKEGRKAEYTGKKGKESFILRYKEQVHNGFTNIGKGTLSGRSHVKNSSITKVNKDYIVKSEDGTKLEYSVKKNGGDKNYFLINEVKSNGNIFRYIYGKDEMLSDIRAMNGSSSIWYSWIHLGSLSKKQLKNNNLVFQINGSNGNRVVYKLKKFKIKESPSQYCIEKVERQDAPEIMYEYAYSFKKEGVQLSKKILPNGRFLNVEYFKSRSDAEFKKNRVKKLYSPVGYDNQPVLTYEFDYGQINDKEENFEKGLTYVFDAKRHLTV